MAVKQLSREEKLAALREKVKGIGANSSGFWSPKPGKHEIRILPETGNMGFFYQQVGKHVFPPDGQKHVYCPKFTSEGELPCPVCELVDTLYKGDAASKKLAGELRVRKSFWMNIMVVGEENAGPQVYTPGIQVFSDISEIIGNPDYGDIYDVMEGHNIVITRTGTGLDTEYNVMPRSRPTPVSPDPKMIKQWLAACKDLSYVEVSEDPDEDKKLSSGHAVYLLPYDRIVSEYDLDGGVEDTEEEEVAPVKSKAVAKPVAKKAKPVIEEVEEDDEETEDEDEDEEPVPAKKEIERRVARRSVRR